MVDINIDSIIRRNLAMRKLPLHYYSPVLVMAKRGLDEMHFDTLQKVKFETVSIDPTTFTAVLPTDCVEIIWVGLQIGDKVRPIGNNQRLNSSTDEALEVRPDLYDYGSSYNSTGLILETAFSNYLGYTGRNFGRPVTFTDSYTVNRTENFIRLDNKSLEDELLICYISLPEKVSNRSVIHPFAQQSLNSWIDWQWARYNGDKDQELRRRDFFNDYRILRARMNKLTTIEIKRTVRNKFGLAVKN